MNAGAEKQGAAVPGDKFAARLAAVYENSPWVSERVLAAGLPRHAGLEELDRAFRRVVTDAGRKRQLELLNAHPELACAEAGRSALSEASRSEQSGAGLDRCSPEEFAEFGRLNRAYRERFGFPFITAVRGRHRAEILAEFRRRIGNGRDAEFAEALRQACRIGRLRLEELLNASR